MVGIVYFLFKITEIIILPLLSIKSEALFHLEEHLRFVIINPKVPIRTAADDICKYFFIVFQRK